MPAYRIPEGNLPRLLGEIEKLNRRAGKLGLAPIVAFRTGEQDFMDGPLGMPDAEGIQHPRYQVRREEIVVEGEAPKLAGWRFVASMVRVEDMNVIMATPGHGLDLAPYRTMEPWCDHCQVMRARQVTYLLAHDDGRIVQVGSSCIQDFLGRGDVHALAGWAQDLHGLMTGLEGGAYDADEGHAGEGGREYHRLVSYLSAVCSAIRCWGWVSRKRAREIGGQSTADAAWSVLFGPRPEDGEAIRPADAELAEGVLAWVRGDLAATPSLDDYQWNLVAAMQTDYMNARICGVVASAVAAYWRRHGCDSQGRTRPEAASRYLGKVGQRQEWDHLFLETVIPLEGGFYGPSYLHKFSDREGNVLIWFGSKELEPNLAYAGKATVKAHEEYQGIKQTVLSRCSFEALTGLQQEFSTEMSGLAGGRG